MKNQITNRRARDVNEFEGRMVESENAFVPISGDEMVECPGCPLFLLNEEQCARHLLHECLLPINSNGDESLRAKITRWLAKFFRAHTSVNVIMVDLHRELMNDRQRASPADGEDVERTLREVKLPGIPFDLQCPVCDKYFSFHAACSKHLFGNCLRTSKSSNALSILDWFSNFLWIDSRSKLDRVTDPDLFRRAEKRVCNYCRSKEFFDKECLRTHFRLAHQRDSESGEAVCRLCNLKPGSYAELFRHFVRAHVICGCLEKHRDFKALKTHFDRGCPKSDSCLCPMCGNVQLRSFQTESEFEQHIVGCRTSVPLEFSLDDLYMECDICDERILKCDVEIHVAEHLM